MTNWLDYDNEEADQENKPRHRRTNADDRDILAEADPRLNLPTSFVSYSQLNLYQQCGRRYYYKYVLGKRQPSSSNLVHGRLCHDVLDELHKYKITNANEMPPEGMADDLITDKVEEMLPEVDGWDPKVPDRETLESAARLLVGLYVEHRLPAVIPRASELRIVALLRDRIPFQGYVDLIEANPMIPTNPNDPSFDINGYPVQPGDRVIDLKMTGRKYGKQRVENSLQLTLYASALNLDKVGYDLMVQKKNSEYVGQRADRSIEEKNHALDLVEDLVEGISAGYFPRTDPEHWMCSRKWCPFFGECRGKKLR